MICQNCKASWSAGDAPPMYHFQLDGESKGQYHTLEEMIASGKSLVFCPKCITPDQERAIRGTGSAFRPERRRIPDD